jgi:uncharacterized coiled-coil DUF342 family protein
MADVIEVTGKILFEIRDEIRGLKANITELNSSITELKQDLKEMKHDLKAVHGFLQSDIISLANRVGRIEGHLHLSTSN